MRMMKGLTVAAFLMAAFAGAALADDDATQRELDELKRRIEELENDREADAASDEALPKLQDSGPTLLTKLGSAFKFYGFARLDMAYNDSEANDTQFCMYAISEDTEEADDEDFSLYTRLSRLGFAFDGGDIEEIEAKLTGKVEIDFYAFEAAASDSRNELRMRHCYLQLDWDEISVLIGQTWDLASPLFPSVALDTILWNQGNLGDRRPQLRVDFHPAVGDGTLAVQGAILMPNAVATNDTDGDGVLDGEDSGRPMLQGRLGYTMKAPWVQEDKMTIGVWGINAEEQTDDTPGPETDLDVNGYGLDARLPIFDGKLWVQGEVWQGKNLDDLRGGIGQGVNGTTEIEARGFWAELGYAPCEHSNLYVGLGVDNPVKSDLAYVNTSRDRNQVVYIGAKSTYLKPVILGLEFFSYETQYRVDEEGDLNRVKFYVMYTF